MQLIFKNIIQEITQLVYPNNCIACNISMHRGEHILCTKCLAQQPLIGDYHKDNFAEQTFAGRFKFEYAYALMYFGKENVAGKLLHALKYQGVTEVATLLGQQLAPHLKKHIVDVGNTVLLPVPLHAAREQQRGFNQSQLIAEEISNQTQVSVVSDAVVRVRYTNSQTKKTRYQRLSNINEAFEVVQPQLLQGKSIIIMDDVCTSGATIEACAKAVLQIPDTKVSIVTAAITVL